MQLIKRDIPDWESKPHKPKDPKNWWKVYKKLKEQIQKDREQGAEKLKAVLDSIKDEREQNLAKVVSRQDLPREPTKSKSRASYNYESGKTGSKSGHKLSLLEKIRKEARDARLARLNAPASQTVKRPTLVTKAPQRLVEEYKHEAQQKSALPGTARRPSAPRLPRPPLATSRQEKPTADKSFLEREERLRALTGGRPNKPNTVSELGTATTEPRGKQPTTLQAPRRPKPQIAQSDGVDDQDEEDLQPSDVLPGGNAPPVITASSPPKRGMGTPPLSRFGSPGPPPKRKAEPSIFMTAKKPRVAR